MDMQQYQKRVAKMQKIAQSVPVYYAPGDMVTVKTSRFNSDGTLYVSVNYVPRMFSNRKERRAYYSGKR